MTRFLPHDRRLYLVAFLTDATFFCGWAAVPFLVKRGDAMQLDDGRLGLLLAVSALAYAVGTLFLSAVWVRRDRALVARVAGALSGLGFVLAAVAGSAWQLFVWLPLGRLALSAFWPNLMALVGEAPGRTLVERIGSFNCWWSTGKAIAFASCGALLGLFGDPRLAMGLCGILAAATVLLIPSGGGRVVPVAAPGETDARERFFRIALGGIFAAYFIGAVWENQFPKGLGQQRFGERFGAGYAFWVNQLLFALYAGQMCTFFLLRRFTGWTTRGWTLVLAAALIAASQIGTVLASSPLLVAVLLFGGGAGFALFYAQSLYHAQAGHASKVRRSGLHEGTLTLGLVVGPPLAGYTVVHSGRLAAAFEINVAVAMLCLAWTAIWLRGGPSLLGRKLRPGP